MEFVKFIEALLEMVPQVAFAAPVIAILIDQLKRVGLPDGYAPLASGLLNLTFFALVYFLPEREGDIATIAEAAAQLAPFVVSFVLSLLTAAKVHQLTEPIGIGYSHTSKTVG